MGPPELDVEWQDQGIEGAFRFLGRVWRLVNEVIEKTKPANLADFTQSSGEATALLRKAHQTVAKVTADIADRFRFNTAISAIMELVNDAYLAKDKLYPTEEGRGTMRFVAETVVKLLDPFSPHICAELWQRLGYERLWLEPWPQADERFLQEETYELVVQVNGKVRDRLQVAATATREELLEAARASKGAARHIEGKQIVKEIVVPGRLVNLVVK
jgi:leucyl-tRNA synthetase